MKIQNNFPNEIEAERIKTIKKYKNLYDNFQEGVLDLHEIIKKQYSKYTDQVYIPHAIPAKISDFYGDFVSGKQADLYINLNSDNNEEVDIFNEIIRTNDIKEKISDFATEQSMVGFNVLLGRVEDGKFKIQEVKQDQYFPQPDGSVIFATYYRDPNSELPLKDRDLYLHTQHYELVEAGVRITRKVWSTKDNAKADQEVSPSVLNMEIKEEELIKGLDELPIVQIDNGKRTRFGFGRSDYHDIMPQIAEINEKVTHISTQLLKNLDAKIELQNNSELQDEEGNLKPFEYIMLPDKEAVKTRYVTNENPLLEEAQNHILQQLKFISLFSGVPMSTVTEGSRPEKVEALKIRLFSAVRKTDTKRSKIVKGIKDIIRIGFKMLEKELKGDIQISFSDVIPVDEVEKTEIEQMKVNSGLTSKFSAIKRLEGYTDEEAEQELERIRDENIESGALNPDEAPQI